MPSALVEKARGWEFFLPNPLTCNIEWTASRHVRYARSQVEVDGAGGRVLHGYVEFTVPLAVSACRKLIPASHAVFESKKRTHALDALNGARWEEGPWEYGGLRASKAAQAASQPQLPDELRRPEADNVEAMKRCIVTLCANMAELKEQLGVVAELKEQLGVVTQQLAEERNRNAQPVQINFNTQNNNIININNFGSEDVSYLTADPELLHQRLLKRGDGVIQTIEDIHFHPDHPENNNVRIRSMKKGTAEIRKGDEWQMAPLDDVARKMLLKSVHLLTSRLQQDEEYRDKLLEQHNDVFDWTLRFWSKQVNNPLAEKAKMLLANKTRTGPTK